MDEKEFICPECEGRTLSVNLLACVTIVGDEITVEKSDVMFDKCAEATCEHCGHSAPLHDFVMKPKTTKVIFTLECGNAAFEDDILGAVQSAFAEASKMATRAIDNDKRLAFVRDINGNQCGRIDISVE